MTVNNYKPRTRDDFWLDGIAGSSLGLAIEIPPVPPLAAQHYTQYDFGGDTMGFAPDTVFDPITITVVGRMLRRPNSFDSTALYAFLQGKKLLKLSRFAGYHFRIRRVLGVTPKQTAKGNDISYQIQFVCDPWKYLDANPEFELPSDGVIENRGTRYSKPIIRFKMDPADATITCNGVPFYINQSSNNVSITIDSDRMLVYKTVNGENISIMEHTQGKLPLFSVGTNMLQVSSNVSSVTVTGNWRCY